MKKVENSIPRRAYLEKLTPVELSIYNVAQEVEKLGAHPLLTAVVVALGEARSKLADWVDLQAAEQLNAADFCPTCLGKKVLPTPSGAAVKCWDCLGTGKNR